jgi:hypothetical protein
MRKRYYRLVRFVLDCLVDKGLLEENKQKDADSVYWRTDKLKALCPEILRVGLPVIDALVRQYDKKTTITE